MIQCFWPVLTIIFLVTAVVLLGWMEEKDMTEINNAFFKMNLTSPYDVIEYLNLIATKPIWRVSIMVGILFGFMATAVYCWSKDIPWYLFMGLFIAIGYISMSGYLSYFNFHIVCPNGCQETINKLQHYNTVAQPRWGGEK
jgi:hypothetical protein